MFLGVIFLFGETMRAAWLGFLWGVFFILCVVWVMSRYNNLCPIGLTLLYFWAHLDFKKLINVVFAVWGSLVRVQDDSVAGCYSRVAKIIYQSAALLVCTVPGAQDDGSAHNGLPQP